MTELASVLGMTQVAPNRYPISPPVTPKGLSATVQQRDAYGMTESQA